MRTVVSFVFIVLLYTANAQKQKIVIQINETRSYCGGIAPTEDVMQEINKKPPFANKTIYIYKKRRFVDSCKTDSAGNLTLKLKKGKYDLLLPWKHFKGVPVGELSEYNFECLKKEWKLADAFLEIKKTDHVFINKRIGHQFCPWQYNCLKERHIPPTAPKQN